MVWQQDLASHEEILFFSGQIARIWEGGILVILGVGMAWPGLGMAWPGLGMTWPGLGMAWPGLGMTWPGWVWRGLAGYGVFWLGAQAWP